MTHTAYNAAHNSHEVDSALASALRETYRDLYFQAADAHTYYGRQHYLCSGFLANAGSADDYTLCELEATYHASRADSVVYLDWTIYGEPGWTLDSTEWRDCYGRIYCTADLFSFAGYNVPVQITVEEDNAVRISWEENSEFSDFPETHSSVLYSV